MRAIGMTKITGILIVDFLLLYYAFGVEAAIFITAGIMLYGWLGEYTALLKDGAIRTDKLRDYERIKLTQANSCLSDDVRRVSGVDISGLKLHVIPSDSVNAFAYGFHNIAITRAALNACDDITLCSVLGHEISHILNMDAVVNRLIFANVTLMIAGLGIGSFVAVSFVWIVFLALWIMGACRGLFSMLFFRGTNKVVKGSFTMLQHFVLFIYQVVMGLTSRRCEFRADRYSCELGYGPQLSYFLTRFVETQENRKKSLSEILYDSHPAAYKRILRIEQRGTNREGSTH